MGSQHDLNAIVFSLRPTHHCGLVVPNIARSGVFDASIRLQPALVERVNTNGDVERLQSYVSKLLRMHPRPYLTETCG